MRASRRRFMLVASTLTSSVVLSEVSRSARPEISEADPTAQSVGYRSDAKQVDTAKYPKYQSGQACANCQLYGGKLGDVSGPCPIFAGKLVAADGWCSAYVKKEA
ncbi:High potential iron-sulfur protein [Caballeronia jiangsuensis]|nr:High potential iron-sulfur protein [Caballeronia jiangsuensis]